MPRGPRVSAFVRQWTHAASIALCATSLSYAHRRRAAKAHTRLVELCAVMNGGKRKRPSRGACGRGVGVWRRLCLGDASRANAPSRADARVRAPDNRPLGQLSWNCAEVPAVGCHAKSSVRVCESGAIWPGAHSTMINDESQRGVSRRWEGLRRSKCKWDLHQLPHRTTRLSCRLELPKEQRSLGRARQGRMRRPDRFERRRIRLPEAVDGDLDEHFPCRRNSHRIRRWSAINRDRALVHFEVEVHVTMLSRAEWHNEWLDEHFRSHRISENGGAVWQAESYDIDDRRRHVHSKGTRRIRPCARPAIAR